MPRSTLTIAIASAAILAFAVGQPASALDLGKTVSGVTSSLGLGGGGGGSMRSGSSSKSSKSASNKSGSHKGGKSGKHGGGKSGNGIDVLGIANVDLGSGKNGGINAKVTTPLLNGTKVHANVLGNKGVANVKARTGLLDTKANVGVLDKQGVASAYVTSGGLNTRLRANVLSDNQVLGVGVSIGGSGGGGGHGGGGNGDGNGNGKRPGALAGMSEGQIQALQVRCIDVLGKPQRFDAQLVALCTLLAQM